MERLVHGTLVRGVDVDPETRCGHYHSAVDVIAIRFPCCDTYFPCRECHDELADHAAATWPADRLSERAVLCGWCGTELAIDDYLAAKDHCPACSQAFNPRCALHYGLYFDVDA